MDALASHHVRAFNELKERLKAEFGLEDGEQTFVDTLEGASYLSDYLILMLRRAQEREAFAKALGEMIENMRKRKARLEDGSDKLRSLVAWCLSETGQKKIEAPDFTATLSKSRAPLLITDDAAAATQFELKKKPEVDRTKLRLALEHGETYWFASLGNPGHHLTVRKT